MDCTRKERMNSIAPMFYLRVFNNSCYHPGANSMQIRLRTQPPENNVSFVKNALPDSASEMKDYRINAGSALQRIHIRVVYSLWRSV